MPSTGDKCEAAVTTTETVLWREHTHRDLQCTFTACIRFGTMAYCRKHAAIETLRQALIEGKAKELT